MSLLTTIAALIYRFPPRRNAKVRVERDIATPMRDGVSLLTDRWLADGAENGPIVLVRSPYGRSSSFGFIGRVFAERGFQVVLQSCRGTMGSGGTFDPMRQEQDDGLDTLDWMSRQPWYSGKIYTFGGSYLGYTEWAIAKPAGERIAGMGLQVTLSNFRNETLAFGGFTLHGSLQWTTMMSGLSGPNAANARMSRRPNTDLAKFHNHLPLGDLDKLVAGREISWWQDWVGHDDPMDPWWAKIDRSGDVQDVTAPAAMIGGWRDIFLPWQVKDFEAMQARGRDVWLTIGPWAHASLPGMGEGLRQSLMLFSALEKKQRPFADRDRVRLYVMGAKRWRDYPSWPPPGSRSLQLFLQPGGGLKAAAPATASAPTAFVYDPRDPTPSLHGPSLMGGARTPDMTALELRRDTVSFTTAPLSSDLESVGPVSAELHVRSDREHTDFYVCLCDVGRSGRPMHVTDGYVRLRPGDVPVDENGARRVTIACWPTAYCFRKGHRLRLIVASGAHPRYARNLGTGEPLGTGTHMVTACQEIFHEAARPSAICVTAPEGQPLKFAAGAP